MASTTETTIRRGGRPMFIASGGNDFLDGRGGNESRHIPSSRPCHRHSG